MTDIQVKYWNYKEEQRHNLVNEKLGYDTLSETITHNRNTEAIAYGSYKEQARHNLATEELGYHQLAETTRHDYAMEQVGYAQVNLGYSQLAETKRHNQQMEVLGKQQNAISQQRADAEVSRMASQNRVDDATIKKFHYDSQFTIAKTATQKLTTEQQQLDLNKRKAFYGIEWGLEPYKQVGDVISKYTGIFGAIGAATAG